MFSRIITSQNTIIFKWIFCFSWCWYCQYTFQFSLFFFFGTVLLMTSFRPVLFMLMNGIFQGTIEDLHIQWYSACWMLLRGMKLRNLPFEEFPVQLGCGMCHCHDFQTIYLVWWECGNDFVCCPCKCCGWLSVIKLMVNYELDQDTCVFIGNLIRNVCRTRTLCELEL